MTKSREISPAGTHYLSRLHSTQYNLPSNKRKTTPFPNMFNLLKIRGFSAQLGTLREYGDNIY